MLSISIILLLTLALLVTQVIRVEITALLTITALALTELLSAEEAVSGFANPATLTVGAMLVLSAGLERAGVVDYIGALLSKGSKRSTRVLLLQLAVPTTLLSAFMNNTAIVALMIPVALLLGRRLGQPASKLLMPVSFFAILGGTCTLIGTSTNILVDSLYRKHGGMGFGMFEFLPMGLIYMGIGCLYIIYLGPKLLPNRSGLADIMGEETAGQFVTEVVVPPESALVGRPLGDVFSRDRGVVVVELIRAEEVTLGPPTGTVLLAGDTLLVEGTVRTIHELLQDKGVTHGTAVADADRVPISRLDLRVVEAVITPNSKFQGEEVRELGLNRKLGINVLALRRMGQHHQYNLRDFELRSGDVILLQGERNSLLRLQEDGDALLIEGVERSLTFPRQAPIAVIILLLVVALSSFNVAPIMTLSLAGVVAMLLTGCLNVAHATRALDSGVLFILAGMIPLGQAISRVGLDRVVADAVVGLAGSAGPTVLISVMYLLTTILTAFLSNNAAAVLLAPICFSIANHLQIDPRPLLVAVAFGSSASFATPIGYQTNTMVMGPGAYRFVDYVRFGGPLNILLWLVATLFIPIFWRP